MTLEEKWFCTTRIAASLQTDSFLYCCLSLLGAFSADLMNVSHLGSSFSSFLGGKALGIQRLGDRLSCNSRTGCTGMQRWFTGSFTSEPTPGEKGVAGITCT